MKITHLTRMLEFSNTVNKNKFISMVSSWNKRHREPLSKLAIFKGVMKDISEKTPEQFNRLLESQLEKDYDSLLSIFKDSLITDAKYVCGESAFMFQHDLKDLSSGEMASRWMDTTGVLTHIVDSITITDVSSLIVMLNVGVWMDSEFLIDQQLKSGFKAKPVKVVPFLRVFPLVNEVSGLRILGVDLAVVAEGKINKYTTQYDDVISV